MFNPKIPVWVYGSLCKYFDTVAAGLGIPFYAEGLDDIKSLVYQNTNISFRLDGPLVDEGSSLTDFRFEVQLFLTVIGRTNQYEIHNIAGQLAEAVRSVIPVYQIPDDPLVQVGCLDHDLSAVENVRMVNFSRVSTSSNVRQIALVSKLMYESS